MLSLYGGISKGRYEREKLIYTTSVDVQKLRVGVGVDVAAGLVVEEGDKVGGVDKVAVDAHGQTVGRVDEERLSLGTVAKKNVLVTSMDKRQNISGVDSCDIRRSGTGGGVTDMGDAHEAGKSGSRDTAALVEDLAGHAEALALGHTAALTHGNTGGILATLLRVLVPNVIMDIHRDDKMQKKNERKRK